MNRVGHRIAWSALGILAVSLVCLLVLLPGCSDRNDGSSGPAINQEGPVLDKTNPLVREVMYVQDQYTPELIALPDVVGTATGLTDDGQIAIIVYTLRDVQRTKGKLISSQGIPERLGDVPVVVEVSGPFKAMDGGAQHRVKQTPPILLGTSGGWRYDLANGYCCGGTLGSLVQKGSSQYILSNYHVFMSDIVSGGNGRVAQAGDPVIQPGLIDVSCNANNAQNVATLEGTKSLPNSNVDAAIAQVVSGMVRTDGAILDVNTISGTTIGASLSQAVKKSGRTTGLTRSTVSGLNATISVRYDNECAGGAAFTKTFTGQIVVKNKGSRFLNSGDSGSLMVQDVTTNPKAVGLLFAGSSTSAIANPIGQVLGFFGATMVGN